MSEQQSGRSKTLLVADDSKATQKVVALTFEDEGWRVLVAGDAEEAWRQIETDATPDIVLADVFMPGGGLRLCERIRADKRFSHIPVVLLVGTFEPFDRAEARRVGADDLLTKPFQSIRDLVGRVSNLFNGRPKEQDDSASTDEASTDERAATAQQSQQPAASTDANNEQPLRDEERFTTSTTERDNNDDNDNATYDKFADQTFDDQLIEAVPAAHFGTADAAPVETMAQNTHHHTQETLALAEPTDELDQPEQIDEIKLPTESNMTSEQSTGSNVSPQQVAQTTPLDPDTAFVGASGYPEERTHEHDALNQNSESQFLINAPDATNINTSVSDTAVPNEAPNETAPPLANDTQTMTHTSYSDQDTPAGESFAEDTLLDIDDSIAPVATVAGNDADVTDDFLLDLPDGMPDGDKAVDDTITRAPQSSSLRSFAPDDALDLLDADESASPNSTASPNEIPVSSVAVQTHNTGAVPTEIDDARAAFAPAGAESHGADYQVGERAGALEVTETAAEVAPHVMSASESAVNEVGTRNAGQISPEVIEQIARRAVEMMSERVVQEIAWEVVPQLAELLIKQRLDQEKFGKE